ncbi:transcriptional repressor LexA [Actinomycetaceae bacterium TAE3-ERU4]|nr:transcriptional repressor LexA [Actinomycetaceae bacterium TAE3-ERU4]
MNSPKESPLTFEDLTERQKGILLFLRTSYQQTGHCPTVREIAQAVGLKSPSSVQHQLDILAKAGFIERDEGRARTIRPVETIKEPAFPSGVSPSTLPKLPPTPDNCVSVPLVGRIAAGAPITAQQEIEDTFLLPERMTGRGELFMLSVHGDSMIDAAICDGDWVVIRRQPVAEPGEIVAAMIDGEATVKVWSYRDGHAWLLPRNPDYSPIPADHAQILGRVVTVLRSL